jgi:hypothetical protein
MRRSTRRKTIFLFDKKEKKLWVMGQRIHHGAVGFVMALFGIALQIHDIKDLRRWLKKDRLS